MIAPCPKSINQLIEVLANLGEVSRHTVISIKSASSGSSDRVLLSLLANGVEQDWALIPQQHYESHPSDTAQRINLFPRFMYPAHTISAMFGGESQTFRDTVDLIERWVPKRKYRTERKSQTDLQNYLDQELNAQGGDGLFGGGPF